jgi:hypothetical protein
MSNIFFIEIIMRKNIQQVVVAAEAEAAAAEGQPLQLQQRLPVARLSQHNLLEKRVK